MCVTEIYIYIYREWFNIEGKTDTQKETHEKRDILEKKHARKETLETRKGIYKKRNIAKDTQETYKKRDTPEKRHTRSDTYMKRDTHKKRHIQENRYTRKQTHNKRKMIICLFTFRPEIIKTPGNLKITIS